MLLLQGGKGISILEFVDCFNLKIIYSDILVTMVLIEASLFFFSSLNITDLSLFYIQESFHLS